jgi:hypothetical protein
MSIMPNFTDYVDLHCERVHDGLFNEPLNVISNFLLFIVAYFLLENYRRASINAPRVKILIHLVIAFGVGSIIFHSTARMWGALFDVLPIAMFAVLYVYDLGRHVLRLNRISVIVLFTIFTIANITFKTYVVKAPDGYVSLIPSLLVMYCIALFMFATKNRSAMKFSLATLLATLAATCRAIDSYMNENNLCQHFPNGTHFLWHSLMAGYIYIVVSDVIVRCGQARKELLTARREKLKRVARKRLARRKRISAKSISAVFSDY